MRPPPFLTARTSPYGCRNISPQTASQKTVDTLVWINRTSPGSGFPAAQYYAWNPFRHLDPVRGDRAVRAGSSVWIQYFSDWL